MTGDAKAHDPAARFDGRVEDYDRFRPSYPRRAVELLAWECGLADGAPVADLGSGTGIWTGLLLEHGFEVFAVEPNAAMRAAAEARFAGVPGFRSVAGRAEDTGLAGASVVLATAAQAFHWFDPDRARAEIARILAPGGWAALIWNERLTRGDLFHEGYEALLLEHGTDYRAVDHRRIGEPELARFFGPTGFEMAELPNAQRLDREGLRGRLLSSSYVPGPGDPRRGPMLAALDALFAAHAADGRVTLRYTAKLYWGRLAG